MADWLLAQLAAAGVTAEKRAIGTHKLGGKEVDLPPVIIGQIGKDPKKVSGSGAFDNLLYAAEGVSFVRWKVESSQADCHTQKTLLIYGHYDVQPALMEDGWTHPPFKLTPDPKGTGRLYGRGSTDDKGPILGWLNVMEAHKKMGMELPVGLERGVLWPQLTSQVNIKMCFEGMEESGSVNLGQFIEGEKDKFFAGADCMCISGEFA